MAQGLEIDLKEIVLSNSTFGPREIVQIINAISEDYTKFATLRDLVNELELDESRSPATSVRLGVGLYILGRFSQAIECLSNSDGGALAFYYQGRSHYALGDYAKAVDCFEKAQKSGYDGDDCKLRIAAAKRQMKEGPAALSILDEMFGPVEQTAEYLYQRGATVAAIGGNPSEVVALYERAVDIDERHEGALFGLALENDRRGNDEKALELYQKAAACFPTSVGTLLNLGLLYEDHGQYDRARRCYDRILDVYPAHEQAVLYQKDVLAAGGDHVDPWEEREREKLSQILKTPVTDFELSVRSRNCLQKMGIKTIGDLTRVSEAELLASKNFGETSLVEIREILTSKGVGIGQYAHEGSEREDVIDTSNLSPDEQAMLERPISDLNLSVRARKCMNRLGLNTIGELIRKTGDDLLECKNFGVTSLEEIREKLGKLNISLRGE